MACGHTNGITINSAVAVLLGVLSLAGCSDGTPIDRLFGRLTPEEQQRHLDCWDKMTNHHYQWNSVTKQCVPPAPYVAAQYEGQEQAAMARQAIARKPITDAIHAYCSGASPAACGQFKADASHCESEEPEARAAYAFLHALRKQGLSDEQAIAHLSNVNTGPPWAPRMTVTHERDYAELAAQLPPDMTSAEFGRRALDACLASIPR